MARTKKAEENIQTQENNQPQLESNEQTQTPPSRQAGANQPQDSPSDYNPPQADYGQSSRKPITGSRKQ